MRHLMLSLSLLLGMTAFGQEQIKDAVRVGDRTFLPSHKGKVTNEISKSDSYAQKMFSIFEAEPIIGQPIGYGVQALSGGDNGRLELFLLPYELVDGDILRLPGSSMIFHFNDIKSIFSLPILSGVVDIYSAPEKQGEFMGHAIYKHEGKESVAIYNGNDPLYLPVSQEEYLIALIQKEEKEQEGGGTGGAVMAEMEIAYQELLKVDREAAQNFKREMENFSKSIGQSNETDIVASCKDELAKLSPVERKRQAYFAVYAMEKYKNSSGLVPSSEITYAHALVKPNPEVLQNANEIHLLTVQWKLSDNENPESPRLYHPKKTAGFALTDDKLFELYSNVPLWTRILKEVN